MTDLAKQIEDALEAGARAHARTLMIDNAEVLLAALRLAQYGARGGFDDVTIRALLEAYRAAVEAGKDLGP